MAYSLKRGESVPTGMKRIARNQLQAAIEGLRGEGGVTRDQAVHEARKCIKKVRALMRLVQTELGDTYKEETAELRGTARKLSQLRDTAALIKSFDDLSEKHKKKRWERSAAPLRTALVAHKINLEKELGGRERLDAMATALKKGRRRVKRWPLEAAGFPAIEDGLEKTFRRGRKALAEAHRTMRSEDIHAWRKRVKDHWYHVRLLEDLWSDEIREEERNLKELEDALGEGLNLNLLRERIQAVPDAYGGPKVVLGVVSAIEEERKKLIVRALKIGDAVYRESPKRWLKTIRGLWKQWHKR
jgi:CHAD domain-containing protein